MSSVKRLYSAHLVVASRGILQGRCSAYNPLAASYTPEAARANAECVIVQPGMENLPIQPSKCRGRRLTVAGAGWRSSARRRSACACRSWGPATGNIAENHSRLTEICSTSTFVVCTPRDRPSRHSRALRAGPKRGCWLRAVRRRRRWRGYKVHDDGHTAERFGPAAEKSTRECNMPNAMAPWPEQKERTSRR